MITCVSFRRNFIVTLSAIKFGHCKPYKCFFLIDKKWRFFSAQVLTLVHGSAPKGLKVSLGLNNAEVDFWSDNSLAILRFFLNFLTTFQAPKESQLFPK